MGLGDKFNDAKDKAQEHAGNASEKLSDFAGDSDKDKNQSDKNSGSSGKSGQGDKK